MRTINSETLIAYSQCHRKAFLLLCAEEKGTPSEYIELLRQKKNENRDKYITALRQDASKSDSYYSNDLNSGNSFLFDLKIKADGLEVNCDLLARVETTSSLGRYSYEPTIFADTHSINKEQKIELLYAGYVLEKIQNRSPEKGTIIGLDEEPHRINLKNSSRPLLPLLSPLQEWREASSIEPPPVILNRHCPYCQFQKSCRAKAEREDNLSILSGMTPKIIRRYEKKGIFTTKQLSYLYKPRKVKKRTEKPHATHKPELQALAIRTGKIYVQQLPDLSTQEVEIFLDIEGVPDQNTYYLIGLLVHEGDTNTFLSFWADESQDEAAIWQKFLEKINQYPTAPIYHYGSYELKAIDKLSRWQGHNIPNLKARLININAFIYGKVYFPAKSNGLKEIAGLLGASWTAPNASGLQSLVWRHHWDKTNDPRYREILVTYNQEDCLALKLLKDKLSEIRGSSDTLSEVDFADLPKRQSTKPGEQIHSHFETILKFAHSNYDKKKIKFRQDENEGESDKERKARGSKKGYQGQRKKRPKAQKTIQVPSATVCPRQNWSLRPTDRTSKRLIIDLVLRKGGMRKTITEYVGFQGYCTKCYRYHLPPEISKYGANQLYGYGFQAWIVYQRVALRMTYGGIAEAMEEQFNEKEPGETISPFIRNLSSYYFETEEVIIHHLLNSPFIHADETTINIRGTTQYVWTFTNDKYVVFRLSKTREAQIAHEFLTSYQGILISDFYSGYDSIACRQQKCWVHLIRDLNDDLWGAPLDGEYEFFVSEVRGLLIPIMEAVQKYGLKKRNLNKFTKQVDRFYERVITDKKYKSELVLKYQKRLTRYQESLFTFLTQDGIPWHNNTAERALRHIAKQRAISGDFHEGVTHDYLRLLGIRQTCRFQDKSFLKFLFSREKNIDQFKSPRVGRRR